MEHTQQTVTETFSLVELRKSIRMSQADLSHAIRLKSIATIDANNDNERHSKKAHTISTVTISKIENGVTRVRDKNARLIIDVINEEREKLKLAPVLISQVTWIIKSDNPTNYELAFYRKQQKRYAKNDKKRKR